MRRLRGIERKREGRERAGRKNNRAWKGSDRNGLSEHRALKVIVRAAK